MTALKSNSNTVWFNFQTYIYIYKRHGSAHVDQHGLQAVSYKTYRDTYHNTYQISRYVLLVEKVYRYTPTLNTISLTLSPLISGRTCLNKAFIHKLFVCSNMTYQEKKVLTLILFLFLFQKISNFHSNKVSHSKF